MTLVPQTESCYPIPDLRIDQQWLQDSVFVFCKHRMGADWQERTAAKVTHTLNLTHLPEFADKGEQKFWKFSAGHEQIKDYVDEGQFTVTPPEVADTYIGQVMDEIRNHHFQRFGRPFQGRCQLVWVNKGACYPLHRDGHTPHRYHIPIWTHPDVWWVFREELRVRLLHMPADGRVWYFDPIQEEHSVVNLSHSPRCHLLMTTGA